MSRCAKQFSQRVINLALVCAFARYAATRGDTVRLRAMLQQGFNPDSSDYGETEGPLETSAELDYCINILCGTGAAMQVDGAF